MPLQSRSIFASGLRLIFLFGTLLMRASGHCSLAELYVHSAEVPCGTYCDFQSGSCLEPISTQCSDSVWTSPFRRVGEALHPGPRHSLWFQNSTQIEANATSLVRFGSANPSGFRQKEPIAISLGSGVWGYSETQLSSQTQKTCAGQLKSLARQQNRQLRVHMGAPAPPRSTSEWAGSWTGVLTSSDFASQKVMLPWSDDSYLSGRVVVTRHLINGIHFLHSTVYGFCRGPTYPAAASLTSTLLHTLTLEVVIGGRGPRLIVGDFNFASDELDAFDVWRSYGWESIQSHAARFYGWDIQPTSKNKKERDMLWLSPEALQMIASFQMEDDFTDHATLSVDLALPSVMPRCLIWPRPATIPWEQVDSGWKEAVPLPWTEGGTPEQRYAQIFAKLEQSLDGHLERDGSHSLTHLERGRGQRTAPCHDQQIPAMARPSRQGEVQLRNNMTGNAVLSWFKQLRRIQSLKQSLESNSGSKNAEVYQLEVWSSICRAKGFDGSFRDWWSWKRAYSLPDTPAVLPSAPPTLVQIGPIFETFRHCFQAFESWHLRQRARLLESKYDKTLKQLYLDLKSERKPEPDIFYEDTEYQILAIDQDSDQVHLDQPVRLGGVSHWWLDDERIEVHSIDEDICGLGSETSPSLDSMLLQRQFFSSTTELHSELLKHWTDRWNAHTLPTDEEWTRITSFFVAHIPQVQFEIAPLTLPMWRRALRRFKKNAARGVDGISAADLLNLPDWLTVHLLQLLTEIELGESEWPLQLLYGVVLSIAKIHAPHEPGHFRPVVIFGTIYRTWSSLRSRQLLAQLAPHIPDACFGFVPTCECPQLWTRLQATIELSLMVGEDCCGMSTDLKKAFNTIPRQHTWELATRLGVPKRVLTPWSGFLSKCTRAFQIGTTHSSTIMSCTGMPEGCALSVFSMVQLCFAFHEYMRVFSGACTLMTYVDNICLQASEVAQLTGAWVCLSSFFELWHMSFDPAKTYTWALTPEQRKQLRVFPFPCHGQASELGGAMNYGRRHRQGHLQQRLEDMPTLWARLKQSKAPTWQKLRALPIVFWTKALHGNDAHLLAPGHFHLLRKQALQALRLQKAGVNGYLKLLSYGNFDFDPEFFHIRRTIHQFRRLCRKEPQLCTHWHLYMRLYDGRLLDGPFSKLVALFSQLGWSVNPPMFEDADGCEFNLLELEPCVLDELLSDAWLQYVARKVNHRATMQIPNLDLHHWRQITSGLNAQDQALTASLLSGAFIDNAQKAKFDVTKTATCRSCGQPDTHAHWPGCPGLLRHHVDVTQVGELSTLPVPTRAHLLVARAPMLGQLKQALLALPDCTEEFFSTPGAGLQELFSDGSHQGHAHPYLRKSAWALLNASTGLMVSGGSLHGLLQSSDTAELTALSSALKWAVCYQCKIRCWIDSKFVVDSVVWLMKHRYVPPQWQHQHLWTQILDLLDQLHEATPEFRWIPSHVEPQKSEDPYDDWWIEWNSRVDREAARLNQAHHGQLDHLRAEMQKYIELHLPQLQSLRTFYINVAKEVNLPEPSTRPTDLNEPQPVQHLVSFTSLLDEGWLAFLETCWDARRDFPVTFFRSVIDWLTSCEVYEGPVYSVSYLEITFGLVKQSNVQFPFGSCGEWLMARPSERMIRPTLSQMLGLVRRLFSRLISLFDLSDRIVRQLDLSDCRVSTPLDGVTLRLCPTFLKSLREEVCIFTETRPIKRACDLARPM